MKGWALYTNLDAFPLDELGRPSSFVFLVVSVKGEPFSVRSGAWRKKRARREHLMSALYLRLKKRKVFKVVKGGPFRIFENPVCCKISKKIEVDALERLKKFENFSRIISEK